MPDEASETGTTIQLYGLADDSIVDGPGIRLAIFVQGCAQNCLGCHNPAAQPYQGGVVATTEELMQKVRANPLLAGITLSGGEPFDQAAALVPLAKAVRASGLTVWAYSGYTFEELFGQGLPGSELLNKSPLSEEPTELQNKRQGTSEARRELLHNVDVLVDGRFVEAKRSLDLQWSGSTNQRVIDVPATLNEEKIVLFG